MNKVHIELMKGDITERETDAIINTANNRLILGSGLGGAIKAKGGISIVEECAQHGTIEIGESIITKGGKLKAKYIIHAVLMEYDGSIYPENIAQALLSSLRIANDRKLRSIAIPDMSVAIVRFSPGQCAETMFTTLKEFLENENRSLELIEVVVWDRESLSIYRNIYNRVFSQDNV